MSHVPKRNGKLYLVSPLSVFSPTEDEISSYQFAHSAMKANPNGNILWLQGEWVEGDSPNLNGQEWSSEELSIKSITANLMPVTLMHDFRTAVGVIADTTIGHQEVSGVSRAKVSTVLAIWAHRFPEAAAEIQANNQAGTLMQSQECDAPSYECSSCEQVFVKPVDETSHCDHLKNGEASRRLLNVTFTGTGLIFGTRGAQGANPRAQLSLVNAEVAKWSDAKNGVKAKKESSNMDEITLKKSEYDELVKRPTREEFDALQAKVEDGATAADEATKAQEAAEVKAKEAEDAKAEVEKELAQLKTEKAQADTAAERLKELGEEFSNKLPETIRERLTKQAAEMSDEDWKGRIEELSELVQIAPEAGAGGSNQTFSKDEISRFNGKGNPAANTNADPSVLGAGMFKAMAATKK